MAEDRWWRGLDAIIVDAVPAGSRVLDVGCGDGGLVDSLTEGGLDAVGVDPRAPDHPRLVQTRVEEAGDLGRFEAACALMALHHADLSPVLAAIGSLLVSGGRLFVYEFAWEDYDDRAASWLDAHDESGADNSTAAWHSEHADLHTGATVRAALRNAFAVRDEAEHPYLARMLGAHDLEREEERLIAEGALPALGWWCVATGS